MAPYMFIFICGALFHSLSVTSLYWTHANNPLIFSALALVIISCRRANGQTAANRTSPILLPALAALFVFAMWPTMDGMARDVMSCTESWPEFKQLAGARLRPESDGLRSLVHVIRSTVKADSNETVLLLPNDANVAAWFERKQPKLSCAIVFADQVPGPLRGAGF